MGSNNFRSACALAGSLVFLFIAPLFAQLSTTATINGTVTDASSAVVPGAKVSARNEATQVTANAESNADGTFVLTGLPVGAYSIDVSKAGFQSFQESGLVLHPATVATVNATLKVGEVGSAVSVIAN